MLNAAVVDDDGKLLARESMEIQLLEEGEETAGGETLRFTINRTYFSTVEVTAERSPALVLQPSGSHKGNGETPLAGLQIPSLLAPDAQLNGSQAFALPAASRGASGNGANGAPQWYEVLLDTRGRAKPADVLLTPSLITLRSNMTGAGDAARNAMLLALAHPPSDGTTIIYVGRESVMRLNKPGTVVRTANEAQQLSWALQILGPTEVPSYSPFRLDLGHNNSALANSTAKLARQYNIFLGWIYGNNPASTPCLHEMGYFTLISGLYAEGNAGLAHQALAQQLRMFSTPAFVDSKGYVKPRWTVSGPYDAHWGPLHDQIPHYLIAVYAHVVNTNDTALLHDLMPVVDKVAGYMLSLGMEDDGILRVPGASGTGINSTTVMCNASNWYDIVCFGHADAYVNVFAIWALDAVAQMKEAVGDTQGTAQFTALAAKARKAFNALFWDDNLGFYRDWVDVNGKSHAYLYADVSFLAITLGVADQAQATRIFTAVDGRYETLMHKYGLTRETNLWATPVNFFPVEPQDLMYNGTLQDQADYPNYENGNTFFHTTGFEIAARARAGQPDEAWEAFRLIMGPGFDTTSLWGAGASWANATTGPIVVSEALTDTMMIVWGLTRAAFGVEPTLTKGLQRVSPPLAPLVGTNASFTFSYLGKDVTLSIDTGSRATVARWTDSGKPLHMTDSNV